MTEIVLIADVPRRDQPAARRQAAPARERVRAHGESSPRPVPDDRAARLVAREFPRRFERYWNDSFAFRRHLIRWHSLAKLRLGVSPSPKALLGQDGYLFYAAEQSVDYFRAVKPFTPSELARWRDDLESRRAWLAERGIRYLVVVAPNKETIYPEFMPPEIRPVRAETPPRSAARGSAGELDASKCVDLRGALRRAKQDGRDLSQDRHPLERRRRVRRVPRDPGAAEAGRRNRAEYHSNGLPDATVGWPRSRASDRARGSISRRGDQRDLETAAARKRNEG